MRMRFARRLLVEDLENRRLLAGNVTVTRSGPDLFVTGDNLANTISIESNGSGGVRVSGFNDASANQLESMVSPTAPSNPHRSPAASLLS